MSFKTKVKHRSQTVRKLTLDARHDENVSNFIKLRQELPQLKKKMEAFKKKIENEKRELNKIEDSIKYLEFQHKIFKKEEKLKEMCKQIQEIESGQNEYNYVIQTANLLNQYYENQNDTAQGKILTASPKISKKKGMRNKTVMDWFQSDNNLTNTKKIKLNKKKFNQNGKNLLDEQNELDEQDEQDELDEQNSQLYDILNCSEDEILNKNHLDVLSTNVLFSSDDAIIYDEFEDINKKSNISKTNLKPRLTNAQLYNKYMMRTDNNYVPELSDNDSEEEDFCDTCHVEMLIHQSSGVIVCPVCGIQRSILIDSDKPSYKEPPKELTSFSYKRINHFNESRYKRQCFLMNVMFFLKHLFCCKQHNILMNL